ncbi:cupin domain-containing protein [Chryseobacterium geocarposphaerae]|uniref:Mannose-6-phosphate isomerase-like protein (Cupin superfamily) n=1 Tax=Chryseobacterium geocarposphaerae TaxID=1416776 RepID=A0A2M9CBQ7_9FLAO|nr:cupin domain-containing protein [Chryseobacterium geocarposphaerae]PJJ68212.1 mannose-6-phosphate isomerase-like protein (cupin superfamily) [Chryseobacterium geocarposphaerae]
MIQSKNNSTHYIWGNGCDSWILKDAPGLSVKQEIMPPGTAEKRHFHKEAEQFFYILKGEAVFYVNEEKFSVRVGEGISVLPESKHYISNESDEVLEFLVISTPSTNNDKTEV